jgi:hypothetical protein
MSGTHRFLRIIVSIVAIAGGAFGGYELMRTIEPESTETASAQRDGGSGGDGGDEQGGGDERQSGPLIRLANLRRALKNIEDELGSGATAYTVRIASDEVVLIGKGSDKSGMVIVRGDPAVDQVLTNAGIPSREGIPISRIDPRVPNRLVTRIVRRYGEQRGNFDYMATAGGVGSFEPTWSVFFRGAPGPYNALLNGRELRPTFQR